jgi:prepilin-type N-terminal cleavage/methylation domain-containing protein
MPRRAFTLVELLVVIAIMVTLMSLIMGGVMLAKRVATRAKATALLGTVASAIDQYRILNNTYPESWTVPATPPTAWTDAFNAAGISTVPATGAKIYDDVFMASSGPPIAYKAAQDITGAEWKLLNVQLGYQLGSLISDSVKDGQLLDPWKQPLRYRPSKWYPYDDSATARIDRENPPGQDSYQLWSAGPDAKDDPTNPGEGGDDIPQWAKR